MPLGAPGVSDPKHLETTPLSRATKDNEVLSPSHSIVSDRAASASATDPESCLQHPAENDRDKAVLNPFQFAISRILENSEPVDMSPEEDQRQWQRALLPRKVRRLEDEVKELRQQPRNRAKIKRLPKKKRDFSRYFDEAKLTAKQRQVASLTLEHELKPTEIANWLKVDRKTIHEHLAAALRKFDQTRSNEKSSKNRAKTNPEKL